MAKKNDAPAEAVEIINDEVVDSTPWEMQRVEIPPLFYDKERYSAPVSVIYNGKHYLIPRGVSGIKVPRVVKEILDQSEYQKQMASNYIKENEGVKNLGDY